MKELDALSNQILERTKKEGQAKLAKKEQQLAKLIEENRLRLVEQQKSQKELTVARSKNELERQTQSLLNGKRNQLLSEKQKMMTAIFQDATVKMAEWDADQLQAFVHSVLKQFETESVHVVPGEKSVKHFTEAFRADLTKAYPGLTVSTDTVANKAGFVVEVGGIDYNFLFDQLVAETKKEFSPKLASLAFQKMNKG